MLGVLQALRRFGWSAFLWSTRAFGFKRAEEGWGEGNVPVIPRVLFGILCEERGEAGAGENEIGLTVEPIFYSS